MKTLEEDPSESGGIDGDAGVPLALELDRLVLADDLAPELQWPALVGHFHELGRLMSALVSSEP